MTSETGENQEIEEVTKNGMCIFIGCEEKASGWAYNIDFGHDTLQKLHACKKHVEIFQCNQDTGMEIGV